MAFRMQRRTGPKGFTLIELLVAISISVILLSILAFVFKLSTQATRSANTTVAITERMRSINIRLRQEIGAMLAIHRGDDASKPCCIVQDDRLTFCADTSEGGKAVSNDVRYEFIKEGATPEEWSLVRYRDRTGMYKIDKPDEKNPPETYKRGDDSFQPIEDSDVLLVNVRKLKFTAIDPPPEKENNTELNPRELPAAIKMEIQFGPDPNNGDPDVLESATIYFPIYRGI